MTRHSKNNTAASVFTKAEHNKLKSLYGTQRARLGADSLRPFDACSLCLCPVVTPVACSKGHLFCRECALKDLVEQKAELERKKKEMELVRKDEERTREEVRQKARERVLQQFERGQAVGIIGKRKERDEDGARSGEPLRQLEWRLTDQMVYRRACHKAEEV
jgi:nitric oxide synthase-interacting protein